MLFAETRVLHTTLFVLGAILCAVVAAVVVKMLSRHRPVRESCMDPPLEDVDMHGKTVVVTGANAGIGFETALELARLGARVIMACRCPTKGRAAAEVVRRLTGNDLVVFALLDVGSLASVRNFAKALLASEERLDVLVNNAGITAPSKKRVTSEGLEVTLATNYLGPFLLTNLLLELLKRSAPSRVVNVTSALYRLGRVRLEDLEVSRECARTEHYGVESTYANSKLLLNLFTVHLARTLQGTGVTCNAVHPGVVSTSINEKEPGLRHFLWNSFLRTFGTSPRKGARGSIHLASSPHLREVTGKYFVARSLSSWSSKVEDEELASKAWFWSEQLVRTVSMAPRDQPME